jgi:hypothetical protein
MLIIKILDVMYLPTVKLCFASVQLTSDEKFIKNIFPA